MIQTHAVTTVLLMWICAFMLIVLLFGFLIENDMILIILSAYPTGVPLVVARVICTMMLHLTIANEL